MQEVVNKHRYNLQQIQAILEQTIDFMPEVQNAYSILMEILAGNVNTIANLNENEIAFTELLSLLETNRFDNKITQLLSDFIQDLSTTTHVTLSTLSDDIGRTKQSQKEPVVAVGFKILAIEVFGKFMSSLIGLINGRDDVDELKISLDNIHQEILSRQPLSDELININRNVIAALLPEAAENFELFILELINCNYPIEIPVANQNPNPPLSSISQPSMQAKDPRYLLKEIITYGEDRPAYEGKAGLLAFLINNFEQEQHNILSQVEDLHRTAQELEDSEMVSKCQAFEKSYFGITLETLSHIAPSVIEGHSSTYKNLNKAFDVSGAELTEDNPVAREGKKQRIDDTAEIELTKQNVDDNEVNNDKVNGMQASMK